MIQFLAAAILLWLAALPLAARLSPRFPDAGAGLAFPLGGILAGTAYFLLRWASILEAGRGGYAAVTAALVLAGIWALGQDRRLRRRLRRRRLAVATVLILFLGAFLGFSLYRSYLPDIAGTEQPMDFLFLNATVRSPDYPPEDPWLAGEDVSYYYLGYIEAGLLTRLAALPTSTGYNLALAWTFAASAAAAWSLALALGRLAFARRRGPWPAVAGGLAVLILLGSGSLIGAFEWSAAHERYDERLYRAFGAESLLPCENEGTVGAAGTKDCYAGPSPRTSAWYPTEFWFWFRDTRVIPGTITEFPVFSFLLGDLHPHLMAIPLVLLVSALALSRWLCRRPLSPRALIRDPATALMTAVALGSLAFVNAWDSVTLGALYALAVVGAGLRRGGAPALVPHLAALAGLLLLAVVIEAPWLVTFRSQAAGLYAYTGAGTAPNHAFLQFGPVVVPALVALVWALRGGLPRPALAAGVLLPVIPLLAWGTVAALRGDAGDGLAERGDGWVTLAAYALGTGALGAAGVAAALRGRGGAPTLVLAATGLLLLLGTELFFIRDVFFGALPRMNTVFKLSYQAWILLAIAGGVGLAGALRALLSSRRFLALPAATGALAVLLASLVYPLIAIPNRTDGFQGPRSLDGLSALSRNDPEEYALLRWLTETVPPGEIVLEGTGRRWKRDGAGKLILGDSAVDYTEAGRVSGRTGLPAPVGWYFHEVQWRGDSIRPELDRRQVLVDAAYTADPTSAMEALRALGATYVVVGRLERSRYPADALTPFASFLDLVWEEGETQVFRVPEFRVVPTS